MTDRGALPERDCHGCSPGDQRHRVAFGVEVDRLQVPPRSHEATRPLGAGTGSAHIELSAGLLDRVEKPQVGAGVIYDPASVTAGEPGVVVLVAGVPLQPAAGGGHRVEVAGPLVVGQEVDASPDPHRIGQISLQTDQWLEVSVALTVYPQRPRGPAAIPLPASRVAAVATDDHTRTTALERDGPCRAEGEQRRFATVDGNGVDVLVHRERATPIAGNQHPSAVV